VIRLFRVERDDWQMLLADDHIRCSRALDVTIQREQFPKSKDPLIIWAGPIIMRVTLARYSGPAPVEQIEKYVADGGYVIIMVKRAGVPQHWVRYLGKGKIVDPWFADIADLLPRYTGKDLAEAIWAAAYYQRVK